MDTNIHMLREACKYIEYKIFIDGELRKNKTIISLYYGAKYGAAY